MKKIDKNRYYSNNISGLISDLIASQYYNISYEEFINIKYQTWEMNDAFVNVDCDIKKKITINELIQELKGEKWEAKKYNVLWHNCQNFAVKIIKILEAVRNYEGSKVRMYEKFSLPGSIITALSENEGFSLANTLGRIPIYGFFHDMHWVINK